MPGWPVRLPDNNMSDFLEDSSPRPLREGQARRLEMLATLLLVALVLGILYVGRDIFIPIAIAILVSFVLSPPILLLRRWGLGRIPSVLAVVLSGLIMLFLVSAVVTRQISDLAVDLPNYQATVTTKIAKLRDAVTDNALVAKVSAALKAVREINPPPQPLSIGTTPSGQLKNQLAKKQESQRPISVEVYQPELGPFAIVQTIAEGALSPLESVFIVAVFVTFILLQREDLRNRFIRLVGPDDLQRTTAAMNDAAARLSRFFLFQTLVNAAFGVVIAVGLYFIGIPSPVLWGIVGFVLRFVPYVGPIIAAGFPMALAAAVAPGWGMTLETLALFLIVEPIIGQAIEPWLYGHHTGISPIAVVISATLWIWLWGVVGLLLSTPLTVCLVVLGRNAGHLAFLDVIFGDAPALTPVETFYQRILVGDASEVTDQAEEFLKEKSLDEYYDEVALPALSLAQADLRRGVLDEARQRRIKETINEVIENLSDLADQVSVTLTTGSAPAGEAASVESAPGKPPSAAGAEAEEKQVALCVAGRSFLDEAAATLLAQNLENHGIDAKVESARTLTRHGPPSSAGIKMACLSFFDADVSTAAARYAVRRLRRQLGEVKIIVGFWQGDPGKVNHMCAATKADFCARNFREAVAACLSARLDVAKFGENQDGSQPVERPVAALPNARS